MAHIMVIQQVEEYDKWKAVFDAGAANRAANGSEHGHLFRDADNPDTVIVLLHWDKAENARRYVQSDEVKEAMQQSGVVGQPSVHFLDEVEHLKA